MGAIGGLGSLVQGFQQGAGFMEDMRTSRKRGKALDYTLAQMGREEQAAQANSEDISDEERDYYGANAAEAFMPEFGQDPYLFRFMDWMGGKFGKRKKKALPVESSGTMEGYDPTAFRDGGKVDFNSADEMKSRAAQNRARSDRGESTTRTVEGEDRTPKPKKQKALDMGEKSAPKKAGFLKSAAGGAAAAAGIGGALQGLNTPTEDYYTRLGMDPREAGLSFWKDVGVRGAGVLSDVGATALGALGVDQRSAFADVQARQEPTAPAPSQALPIQGPAPAGSPTAPAAVRSPVRRGVSPSPTTAPQEDGPPQPGDAIDMSSLEFDSSELPDMNVEDWKRYRAQALRTARLRGMPQAQALDEVDKVVTGMQQRGFLRYGQQAQALMQAGNMQGAARALRAAYQYFPNGRDMKIGVQGNNLIAVGYDEQTKKQDGRPMLLNPERLDALMENFSKGPGVIKAWTKDWRDEAFKNKQYNEVTKPLAEAQGQALRTNAEANIARAETAELRASMAGGAGGLKPADMARSEQVYRSRLELLGISGPENEAKADQLAAVMSQIKQANPSIPDNTIVDFVMKAVARPDGDQFIQRALSGQ